MARPTIKTRVDMSIPALKREVMNTAGTLQGMYDVEYKPVRETRSTRANAYYFAVCVKPFYDLLSSQEPTVTDPEQAHTELKRLVLGTRPVRIGGIVSRILPTTHDMDVPTFMDYVERVRHFLREQVGIETLDPGQYGIKQEKQLTAG